MRWDNARVASAIDGTSWGVSWIASLGFCRIRCGFHAQIVADMVWTEIFLPSYIANFDFDDLERKQDPVKDIIVTDEEVANMFPS